MQVHTVLRYKYSSDIDQKKRQRENEVIADAHRVVATKSPEFMCDNPTCGQPITPAMRFCSQCGKQRTLK